MVFPTGRIERLARDVAAAVAADLPALPGHRTTIPILGQLFHIALGNADVVNILRPKLDLIAIKSPTRLALSHAPRTMRATSRSFVACADWSAENVFRLTTP